MSGIRSAMYVVLGFVLVMAAAFLCVYFYAGQQTVPGGLSVSQWEAQGLTYGQFREQFQAKVHALKQQRVTIGSKQKGVGFHTFTFEQLGLIVNDAEILNQIEALRHGSVLERAKKRWALTDATLELTASFRENILRKTINGTWKTLQETKPVQAKRIITEQDTVTYVPEKPAYRIDQTKLEARLRELIPARLAEVTLPGPDRQVELALTVIKPPVTVASLQAERIRRKIGEFTTPLGTSGQGRIYNIQSTAKTVHDMMLKPGEIFDYSRVIEQTEQKFGFKEAPVIMNGKLVPGIGGGICQVSTTLYNAVLRTGLDIVERRNHSLPVSYVPLGQDATFADGYINFKFRNNTGGHLLIRTSVSGNRLTVKLFGDTPENMTYDIESRTVRTIDSPIKYVKNPKLARGKQMVIQRGKQGYVVETYRIAKKNGVIVERKRISRDTYKAQPTVIAVNWGASGNEQPPAKNQSPDERIVEDGVRGPVFQ